MAKLMIPFAYPNYNMLDYYDYKYTDNENNRRIYWNTKNNYREWFPYRNENTMLFFEKIESGEIIEVDEVKWVENYEFEDTLIYSHYSKGRSSTKIHFISKTTDKPYEMFLTDFDDLLKYSGFMGNEVKNVFTFCKRGANYGIKLAVKED